MQRHTWGGGGMHASLLKIYNFIRHEYPYWNASGGRDHVFFMPGEKSICIVPKEMLSVSIVIGHWGGRKGFSSSHVDCVNPLKDVVVPPITPIQHDLAEFQRRLEGPMRLADQTDPRQDREGPLLLIAGGVFSFGASQERDRKKGVDSRSKQEMWQARAEKDRCADPSRRWTAPWPLRQLQRQVLDGCARRNLAAATLGGAGYADRVVRDTA
eukprot:2039664-Prymnesium_polylepis.2